MVDATEELWDIHDRMPVILHPDDHEAWLNAPAEEAMALVRKYPADRLTVERTANPWFKRMANGIEVSGAKLMARLGPDPRDNAPDPKSFYGPWWPPGRLLSAIWWSRLS